MRMDPLGPAVARIIRPAQRDDKFLLGRGKGVSRARLQQVDQGGDVRDVAEVVNHMQAFFDLLVT